MRYLTLNLLFFLVLSSYGQTPTSPASKIIFTFTGCNEIEMEWTNGNGSDRVVFVREDSAISDVPVDNEYYSYNPIFGKGESIKGDNKHFCVSRGPVNNVTVTGLKNLSKYYVAVFEYNSSGPTYNYKTDFYPTKDITTKNIIANGYLTEPFKTNHGEGQQCLNGNSFQFKNKSTSDINPISYTWKFGDGNSSTLTEPKHTYKMPGIRQVTLIATSKGCSNSNTFYDTVHPHPVAKFDYETDDTIQCWYGNRFIFKYNKTTLQDIGAGISSMRYEWFEVPGTKPFSTSYKGEVKFKTDGKKTIKLVAVSNRGCRDSFLRNNLFTVLPRSIDPSKISVSPDTLPLKNNKFTFTNTNTKTWQIRSKNNPAFKDSIRGMSVNYSFNAVGRYYISFDTTDSKTGCYDKYTDSVEVKKDVGVVSNTVLATISVYSNPSSSGVFQIKNLPADASLKVYDIVGKELLNLNPQQANLEINLSHFGEGIYILSLWIEGRKFDYRLIVL